MSTGLIVLVAAIVIGFYGVLVFNNLVRHKNRFLNAFSQIDVQLQRRHELIPNLVEVAKGYLKHEAETLQAVTQARNTAADCARAASADPSDASLVHALASAESSLSGALGKLNVVMEAYPDLKADTTMQDLHTELTSTENRVGYARQAYSDAVMRYNAYREQFPPILVAQLCGFKTADLFEVADEAMKQPLKVSFS